ncbi:MAG: acyl-CoA thioesterase [Verrucomicrobia bacterium]|jgi:acyl-CoA thioester hydrolase|nr:acyl-CoA thioesterase [Verrucomicrobiota bacterium]
MASDLAQERFELPIQILPADIDMMGHVNNVVYVRWVQDAATAHWEAAATPEQQEAVAWVVVRHEIDYKSSARLGDEIIARTWVGAARRNLFERYTEIVRKSDLKVLCRALSLWCPIDLRTGRVTRVGPDIRNRFSVPETIEPRDPGQVA